MFREMRRKKQALSEAECQRILEVEKRGTLAVNGDGGYPYALPMNYLYDADGNSIYLHSATTVHKIDSIRRDDKVCFMVRNRGVQKEGDWSYFVDSVIAFGRAHEVADETERLKFAKRLGLKYYPGEAEVEVELHRDLSRMLLIRIDIEHMSGKHVHER